MLSSPPAVCAPQLGVCACACACACACNAHTIGHATLSQAPGWHNPYLLGARCVNAGAPERGSSVPRDPPPLNTRLQPPPAVQHPPPEVGAVLLTQLLTQSGSGSRLPPSSSVCYINAHVHIFVSFAFTAIQTRKFYRKSVFCFSILFSL